MYQADTVNGLFWMLYPWVIKVVWGEEILVFTF